MNFPSALTQECYTPRLRKIRHRIGHVTRHTQSTTVNPIWLPSLIFWLRLGACLCFAGWTWTHLYWEPPYGVLVWHDSTYQWAQRLGISWDEFVGTGANDGLIQVWLHRLGWIYLLCAILCLTVRKGAWLQMTGLGIGTALLVCMSWAKYVKSGGLLPMFVEHGGQMLCAVLLCLALTLGPRHRITIITAIVAFISTFAGHGAFALGLWQTPSSFYGMTQVILNCDYDTANLFLRTAGVLDMIICVGIFIPGLRCASALYGAAWGLATALARPVSGMSTDLLYWGADQFIHQAVLRTPHWAISMYLFFIWWQRGERQSEKAPKQPTTT